MSSGGDRNHRTVCNSDQESLQNSTRLQATSAGVYKLASLSAEHKVKKKRKVAIFREMPKID